MLLPRSDLAAALLPDALSAMGYRVDAVTAYRTVVQQVPGAVAAESVGGRRSTPCCSPRRARCRRWHGVTFPPSTVLGAIGRPTTCRRGRCGASRAHVDGSRTDRSRAPGSTALVDASPEPPSPQREKA